MQSEEITVVCTFHNEDYLIGSTVGSLIQAVESARSYDISVEILFALDRATTTTSRLVRHYSERYKTTLLEFDYGDQGLVRNECVRLARGEVIAFLDGDDMFGYDWIWRGKALLDEVGNCIVHPELNIYFDGRQSVFVQKGSDDPYFDFDYFRVGNYWDAMCMCLKDVLLTYPYRERDLMTGFAYEDWEWNMRTLGEGVQHLVVPDTVHFKRARQVSQSKHSRDRGVVFHTNKLSYYETYESLGLE